MSDSVVLGYLLVALVVFIVLLFVGYYLVVICLCIGVYCFRLGGSVVGGLIYLVVCGFCVDLCLWLFGLLRCGV